MRNVSFNLKFMVLTTSILFVVACSAPLCSISSTQTNTEPPPTQTPEPAAAVIHDGPVMLVTEAIEQNKDTCITEVVEMLSDNNFPWNYERRIANRSYWFGIIEIEPIAWFDQPIWWVFVLAVLSMFSPKAYRVPHGQPHSLKVVGHVAAFKTTVDSRARNLRKLIPIELECSSLTSCFFPFLLYALAFNFIMELGWTDCKPLFWLMGFGVASVFVILQAAKIIGSNSLGWTLLRSGIGAFFFLLGGSFLALIVLVIPSWSSIPPLGLLLAIAFSSFFVIAALYLMRFRFSVFQRIASIKSVSCLGLVLSLVTFASGFFYGDNKTVTYVDPEHELHTFY
jgi:hypothetical protein